MLARSLFIMALIALTFSCSKGPDIPQSCKGEPIPGCVHTQEYDPVCGCNGVTYGNKGEAQCAGVKSWSPGECQ